MPRRRPLATACALMLALAGSPLDARAHAIIIASQPASGATLPAGHVAFELRYNSRVDAARSRLILTRPDASTTVLPIAGSRPDVLVAAADLPPGSYSLRWQVLAVDGHITRGDIPFTLTQAKAAP